MPIFQILMIFLASIIGIENASAKVTWLTEYTETLGGGKTTRLQPVKALAG